MVLGTIILILILIITLLWLLNYWNNFSSAKAYAERNLKHVQPGNLFLIVAKGQRFEVVNDAAIKREGPVFGFNLFGSYTMMCADPELIQLVLSKEFSSFTNRRKFNTTDPILSDNVMFTEDEQWKRLRSIISPAFTIGKMKRMKPCFDDAILNLVKNLENSSSSNQIIDLKKALSSFSLDVIIQTAFGIKIDAQTQDSSTNPTLVNARKLMENSNSVKNILIFTVMFLWPWLSKTLDLRWSGDVTDYFRKLALEVIDKKRKDLKGKIETSKTGLSFIELMLEAEDEILKEKGNEKGQKTSTNKYISNDEIIANCIMFFLAGFDTTTTSLSLALYNLALHPETQQKLYQEIEQVLLKLAATSDHEDPLQLVSIDNLSQFEYLNAVVNETLRLYPPAIFIERTASHDITLETQDYKINVKKNDIIHIPIYSLHLDSKQFPGPEKFKPERFLNPDPSFHKYAYIPFGSGPRNCIAKNLGYFATKLALIQLVWNFRFYKCSKTKIPLEFKSNGDLASPQEVVLRVEKR